jgi:hypothetical protein
MSVSREPACLERDVIPANAGIQTWGHGEPALGLEPGRSGREAANPGSVVASWMLAFSSTTPCDDGFLSPDGPSPAIAPRISA